MIKSPATSKIPLASSARRTYANSATGGQSAKDKGPSIFLSASIGMGWQLAVLVLGAIYGGNKLDQVTGNAPVWTLVGLVVATVGSILVVRRALNKVAKFTSASPVAISDADRKRNEAYDAMDREDKT